jgi:hypothetical protein
VKIAGIGVMSEVFEQTVFRNHIIDAMDVQQSPVSAVQAGNIPCQRGCPSLNPQAVSTTCKDHFSKVRIHQKNSG